MEENYDEEIKVALTNAHKDSPIEDIESMLILMQGFSEAFTELIKKNPKGKKWEDGCVSAQHISAHLRGFVNQLSEISDIIQLTASSISDEDLVFETIENIQKTSFTAVIKALQELIKERQNNN